MSGCELIPNSYFTTKLILIILVVRILICNKLMEKNMRFGELLEKEGLITKEQLEDALDLQKFNQNIPIGEILLTQGIINREQLVGYIEAMIFLTGEIPAEELELLDQSEVDSIMNNYNDSKKSEKNSI